MDESLSLGAKIRCYSNDLHTSHVEFVLLSPNDYISQYDISQMVRYNGSHRIRESTMAHQELASKAEYEILAEFRYTLRRFLRFSEMAASQAGLTPQQHQALLAIKGFPGRENVTIGELAERLQIQHHSAVGLVDRLEAAKLIKRSPGSDDRRKVYISLTAHGASVIEKLSTLHHEQLLQLTPQLQSLIARIGKWPLGENGDRGQ